MGFKEAEVYLDRVLSQSKSNLMYDCQWFFLSRTQEKQSRAGVISEEVAAVT